MEILSKEIDKHIQEKSKFFNPVVIKNIDQIKTINEKMNDSYFATNINSYVDKRGNICYDERRFDGHRYYTSTRQLNFPYRIDFNWKKGSLLDENIFCPRIYLASRIDDETDFQTDILEAEFISAVSESKTIEIPKITMPEPFKRINLSEFFPESNYVLVCLPSEVDQIVSRLSATK